MSLFREISDTLKEVRRDGKKALRGFTIAASFFRSKESSKSTFYRFLRYLFTENGELDPRAESL